MSSALATQQPARRSALVTMAARLNVEEGSLLKTLKETVCKGCSDSEVMAFSVVANEYALNPFIKQIYAFPAKGGGIVPVVSIDGWVAMVNNHPQMDGMEFDYHRTEAGKLEAVTCTIWRKDRTRPIKVTEILEECRRNTDPWKMENRMLRHKALMQCARYAFGFSGITDEDEGEDMRQAVGREVTSTPATPNPNPFAEPPAALTNPPPAATEAPAEVLPPREAMVETIRSAIGAAGIKNVAAAEIFRGAGLLQAALLQDATDAELFAINKRLDLLPPKQEAPAAEAQPVVEAKETAPAAKTDAQRKDDALASIEEQLLGFDDVSLDAFGKMCREQKLMGATQALRSLGYEKLENIAGSVAFIIKTAREGGDQ